MASSTRVFVIGDEKHGLTIVVTDPVAVFYYSPEELQPGSQWNPNKIDPSALRAFVLKELIPVLRGVDLDDLEADSSRASGDEHYRPAARDAELKYAHAAAAQVRDGGQLHNVDFCMAFEIKTKGADRYRRSVDPAMSVVKILNSKGEPPLKPVFSATDPFPPAVHMAPPHAIVKPVK
jgi:hypothetical protein